MRTPAVMALFATALGIAACATYYDDQGPGRSYGDYRYSGRSYQRVGNDCGRIGGAGGETLDPWLACTREGRALLRGRFDSDGDARLTRETADRANIWFRRLADSNRDMRLTDSEIRRALARRRG